ncbi:MAG: E3 binding domain-containing protein, partial [Solirubrobacterales bacterium]
MAEEIVMPRLSDSMEEGTILKWMKAVGDEVALGDELVEIETDKANMVFEADAAGTLVEITAQEGDTLPIGEVIARVGEAGEAEAPEPETAPAKAEAPQAERAPVEAPAAEDASDEARATEPEAVPSPTQPAPAAATDGRVKASPLARRIAAEKEIDLSSLSGSGPGGRIIKADVERAEAAPAAAPAEVEAPAAERGPDQAEASEPAPTPPAPATTDGRVKASPLARRIAGEKGI